MNELIIEAAQIEDFQVISDIGKVAVEEAHRGSCSAAELNSFLNKNYNEDAIKAELQEKQNRYYILTYKGQPAGFSKMIFNAIHPDIPQANVTKLDRIYLLSSYVGIGLGFKLIAYNIQLSKRNHQSGMWLYTWVENKRAIDFYLHTGFTIIGSHQFKITETHSNANHHMLLTY